ncbi:hypothetical protein [Actinomadura bangladeshensis]|uniref:Uncharacterized protein n=1 Tax=Actinomadura bangladeshensis TaxID=453573 RepID=A0A6L9QFM9_9ACTN|nr:hypothetical protein [Actinomadura bangladeshensis]NEA23962.1 hypothetical protein [Actinomadura bangladeshensis]
MTEKPGKPEGRTNTEPEREDPPPPRAEPATGAPRKGKPGDAARKMRAMFKGR